MEIQEEGDRTMKTKSMKTYQGAHIRVKAFERGGYYILRICEEKPHFVATKRWAEHACIEAWWGPEYEVKFEAPYDKNKANNYFRKIKETHKDLVLISDEPNTYIRSNGTKATF